MHWFKPGIRTRPSLRPRRGMQALNEIHCEINLEYFDFDFSCHKDFRAVRQTPEFLLTHPALAELPAVVVHGEGLIVAEVVVGVDEQVGRVLRCRRLGRIGALPDAGLDAVADAAVEVEPDPGAGSVSSRFIVVVVLRKCPD